MRRWWLARSARCSCQARIEHASAITTPNMRRTAAGSPESLQRLSRVAASVSPFAGGGAFAQGSSEAFMRKLFATDPKYAQGGTVKSMVTVANQFRDQVRRLSPPDQSPAGRTDALTRPVRSSRA